MHFPFARPPPPTDPEPAQTPPIALGKMLVIALGKMLEPEYIPYIAGLAALLVALSFFWPKRRPATFRKVPGALPLIGNTHQLGQPEDMTERFEEWLDKYGEDGVCECTIAGMRYIIVGGLEANMELMRQRPGEQHPPVS